MITLPTHALARTAIFAATFLLVAGASFYAGVTYEGAVPSVSSSTETYTSEVLGLAFEYPSELGNMQEQAQERGACDEGILTATDQCDHRYIGIQRAGEARWFLSAESALFSQYPLPREMRYEDTLTEQDIEEYCTHGPLPVSCVKETNAHGLRYVKVGYSPACNGFEVCSDQVFFVNFIETTNPDYPVVVAWYDRSGKDPVPDAAIDQMVQSMRGVE